MATTVRVRNNKTGLEREVSYKAFSLLPKLYTSLAFYDKDGNEVENPALTPRSSGPIKKKPAEVVVVEPQIEKRSPGRPKMTDEERAAKKAELSRLNDQAIEKAKNKNV
jgi:hypothetical protein